MLVLPVGMCSSEIEYWRLMLPLPLEDFGSEKKTHYKLCYLDPAGYRVAYYFISKCKTMLIPLDVEGWH